MIEDCGAGSSDMRRLLPSRAAELPAERLMQQRLLQRIEGGELLLVEGFETLHAFAEGIEFAHNLPLHA